MPNSKKIVIIAFYGVDNRGVRYISSVLKKNGYSPAVIFFKEWKNNNVSLPTEEEYRLLLDFIRLQDPVIVGIGFGTPYLKLVRELTARIKKTLNLPILLGGIHATISPEDCIEFADYVCIGEGEYPTLELMRRLMAGEDTTEIGNLWVKKDGKVFKNEMRQLIENLDELPFPDIGEDYIYYLDYNLLRNFDPLSKNAEYRIFPSRGCPFACSYCYNSILTGLFRDLGKYYRIRSPRSIIDELNRANKKLKRIRKITFDGDTFVFTKEWLQEFHDLYLAEIHLPFGILLHPNVAKEEYLRILKDAGLTRIQMGVQSVSEDEVEGVYKRSSDVEKLMRFAEMNKEFKFDIVYDIILDNPLSTWKDKELMFKFLLDLPRPFKLYLYSLTVFPKTGLADILLKKGIITEDDIEGKATKSFRQFRLSLDYPRPKEELYWACLFVLITKNYLPLSFIRFLSRVEYFKKNPAPLKAFAIVNNFIKMFAIAIKMYFDGELTWFKIKQYFSLRSMITQ